MAFTETTSIQEIVILPLESNVQIKRRTVVQKDGEVVSIKDHYELYASGNAEAVAILQAQNTKGIADASVAIAAKATAESALAAKDATIASLQAQIAAYTPAPATTTVTARQIRLALTQVGLRNAVEAAVAAGDQATKDWYEYANEFERSNPLVVAMGSALGVSEQGMAELFALAATL